MPLERADLHTHTTFSDGVLAPDALVRKAVGAGLAALAVTDHDTLKGIGPAVEAASGTGLTLLSGTELTVDVLGQEVHMLALLVDAADEPLNRALAWFRTARHDRAGRIVDRLAALGLPLELDVRGGTAIGRPHIARALVDAGYVPSTKDAFRLYLYDGGPAYVPKAMFTTRQALDLVHQAGGIAVLAHPGALPYEVTDALIRAGLDGIETVHPSHNRPMVHYYRHLVRRHALIESAGSDYHGSRPEDEINFGRFTLPWNGVDAFRNGEEPGNDFYPHSDYA